ncbi:MAG: hypothetical protein V3V31_12555 [Methylococcales bacterium]
MHKYYSWTSFFKGLIIGITSASIAGFVGLYILHISGLAVIVLPEQDMIKTILDFAYQNLRLSIIPFSVVFIFYLYQLRRLNNLLQTSEPATDRVFQLEHVVDASINVFFGIGVIWTAIGMRSALLYGLGDPTEAADGGAFAILQRLVDGGILLALSTTIFGGVGGYLMRVVKILWLGTLLHRFYNNTAKAQSDDVIDTLKRMEFTINQLLDKQEH